MHKFTIQVVLILAQVGLWVGLTVIIGLISVPAGTLLKLPTGTELGNTQKYSKVFKSTPPSRVVELSSVWNLL